MASAKTVCDTQPHSLPSGGLATDYSTEDGPGTLKLFCGILEQPLPSLSKNSMQLVEEQWQAGWVSKMHKLELLLSFLLSPKKLMCLDIFIQEVQILMLQKSPKQDERMRKSRRQVRAAEAPSKKNIRKSYKPLNKQKPEEELKDKNQLLEAVNQQLHQKLAETQGELKDLTQKVELLEKFQDNCLAILESKGLSPGIGTLASQREPTTDHTNSMLLLETLQGELKAFNETAKKQMEELQALKVKLKLKEEERLQFLEQQNGCKDQASDFTVVLEEMEQLLEM
ncbi:putative TRAF4-associated factor 1-like protein [Cricetulus griseus]|nr:putative TRAF4-associated factor 1-like protein [Cricetulus griseus]